MFEKPSETSLHTNQNQDTTSQLNQTYNEQNKPHLGLLHVDRDILNQMSEMPLDVNQFCVLDNSINLKEFLNKLIRNNLISDKTLTIQAFYQHANQNEQKFFEVKLKRIRWNRFDAVAVLLNDTTDQENLIALKVASAHKDKIIGTVSHELRTPLNGIIGLLEMAEKNIDNFDAKQYVSFSKDNARLLLSLVNSHLDLQQLSAGKFRLNPANVNLHKVLNDIISLLQFQASQKGISLACKILNNVHVNVITDENRFKQILINLIGNAIKFTSKGGITVEVYEDSEDSEMLIVSVIDTGIGIKRDDLLKLFTMYGRLEDGRNINKTGVGLGLTISNALASLLSGKKEERGIEVESKYGQGSKFSFKMLKDVTLPLHEQSLLENRPNKEKDNKDIFSEIGNEQNENQGFDEFFTAHNMESKLAGYVNLKKINLLDLDCKPLLNDTSSNYPTKEINSSTSKLKSKKSNQMTSSQSKTEKDQCIIIVDDNPFNLLVTGNLVKDFGFPFHTATSGSQAIEITKQCVNSGINIKAILMDCQMPIMDGYETSKLLCQMMKEKEIPKIPILALTANNENEEELIKCLDAGMEGYLTKPTSKEILFKALSNLS